MRFRTTRFTVFVLFLLLGVSGRSDELGDDILRDAASTCGKQNAFGAISRLPSVRTAVYDPVSNSFAFVRACTDEDKISAFNRDFLDRQRLTLTTQKIRLLVMPYNARTTHLTLVKANGTGVEFDPFFSAVAPPAEEKDEKKDEKVKQEAPPADKPDAMAPKETPPANKKEATQRAKKPKAEELWRRGWNNVLELREAQTLTQSIQERTLPSDVERQVSKSTDPIEKLGTVSGLLEAYRKGTGPVQDDIDAVRTATRCLDRMTDALQTQLAQTFLVEGVPFSFAYDRTLRDIIDEARRRHNAIRALIEKVPHSCVDGSQSIVDFAEQTRQLDLKLDGAHSRLNAIAILLEQASDLINDVRSERPSTVTAEEWTTTVDAYADTLDSLRDFRDDVQNDIDDARTAVDGLIAPRHEMIEALEGPAAWIQRRNYPPLAKNQSLILTFRRSVADPNSTTPKTIDDGNELELRSAPTDVLRITTGLVKSGFRNPTFKVGPDVPKLDSSGNPDKDANGDPIMQHQIQFLEENNGKTLPAVFVHNYWERRSANLQPTSRERFLPTLSLGVTLAADDPLEQVLLGLDWELITGVDLNVGAHFGKANRLDKGPDNKRLHVGDFIRVGQDLSLFQSKHYTSALYFGLSLNSDAFAALIGNRKNP